MTQASNEPSLYCPNVAMKIRLSGVWHADRRTKSRPEGRPVCVVHWIAFRLQGRKSYAGAPRSKASTHAMKRASARGAVATVVPVLAKGFPVVSRCSNFAPSNAPLP